MPTLRDITTMCREGLMQEAYEIAMEEMKTDSANPWTQRKIGWVLYYMMKNDAQIGDYYGLLSHLEELKQLDLINTQEDKILLECILFSIAGYVKEYARPTDIETPGKLSALFSKINKYEYEPSKAYSFLLQTFIKCDNWPQMADFLDWWNLDKLREEDHLPYQQNNGRTIISLAERAFIAKSKVLLRIKDLARIKNFLPQIDALIKRHPEMLYPGYFYGKLLLSFGNTTDEALKVIMPFAQKKYSEFWVWQLLSEVFVNEQQKQLACLLRAVNCRTEEKFLGKVRITLAELYIRRKEFDLAKYQIDKVTQCYLSQGWRLPSKIDCWIVQPWFNTAKSSDNASIDYLSITNEILCKGAEESIAVVTYVDANSHKATLVYGKEKYLKQKLQRNLKAGDILKITYIIETDGKARVLKTEQARELPPNLNYVKIVEGHINKRDDKDFAFLKTDNGDYFISPNIVKKNNLQNNESVKSIVAYDYNQKKMSWDWRTISIITNN